MGENIGAAARAMWNFGLSGMRLVAPRDGWPNPTAVAMASGAGRILDRARLFENVAGAIGDCTFVMATTARERDMTKPVLSPERAMQEAVARIAAGQRVAMLFGPERAGLDNDDVARANALVSVPVNPEFPSLNLAQCVLLCGYEWRRATTQHVAVQPETGGSDQASAVEIARLADHYEARLDEAGFFYPEHKAARMKRNLRNLWSRMPLTGADVRILHGIMRQMVRRDGRG
jgi:tRNA/rRNA methyltransferase